jgi:hypothetical protein
MIEQLCTAEVINDECISVGGSEAIHSYTPSYNLYVPSTFIPASCAANEMFGGSCTENQITPATCNERPITPAIANGVNFTQAQANGVNFVQATCENGDLTPGSCQGVALVEVQKTMQFTYTTWTLSADECTNGLLLGDAIARLCIDNQDKTNCCYPTQDSNGTFTTWKCYGVDPLVSHEIQLLCPFTAFDEDTITVDIPYTDHELSYTGESTPASVGPVKFVTASCNENAITPATCTEKPITQAIANGVDFIQATANGVNFIPGTGGGVNFTQAIYVPEQYNYVPSSDEYVPGSCGQAMHTEAQATISCPEALAEGILTRDVKLEQLITKTCAGDTINIRGSGYVYDSARTRVIMSRFAVFYQKPGKAAAKRIFSEDRSLVDVIDREFTEERTFTFDNLGTYTFKFWIYVNGHVAGKAQARIVEIVDCQLAE